MAGLDPAMTRGESAHTTATRNWLASTPTLLLGAGEVRETPAHEVVGAGAFARTHVPWVDRLSRRLIDQRQLDSASGLPVHEFYGRAPVARHRPLVAELRQRVDQEDRVAALAGQQIFKSVRPGLILPPLDQSVALEM